jgi:hypothetical protein
MAKTLTHSGIVTGQSIKASEISQSIDALTGTHAYDITISGSLTVNGPIAGTVGTINNLTSSHAITALTASYALNGGGGGGSTLQQVMQSGSSTTIAITGSNISASGIIYMSTASIGGGLFTSASLAAGGGGSSAAGTNGVVQLSDGAGGFKTSTNSQFYYDNTGGFVVGDGYDLYFISQSIAGGMYLTLGDATNENGTNKIRIPNGATSDSIEITGSLNISGSLSIQGIANVSASIAAAGSTGGGAGGVGTLQQVMQSGSSTSIAITGSIISASGNLTALNLNLFGGGLDIKNAGAQSYARFYCESANAHYTEVKAQPHALFSGNPVMLLPAYNLDFAQPLFDANITASGNISASGDIIGANISASTITATTVTSTNLGGSIVGYRPIATHTSNFNSDDTYDGHHNIVGGNLVMTVTTGSGLTPGLEWDVFQTSSAGNFTFTPGTSVDIISKDSMKRIAKQGSAATLKYISGQTFHLVGDLIL